MNKKEHVKLATNVSAKVKPVNERNGIVPIFVIPYWRTTRNNDKEKKPAV